MPPTSTIRRKADQGEGNTQYEQNCRFGHFHHSNFLHVRVLRVWLGAILKGGGASAPPPPLYDMIILLYNNCQNLMAAYSDIHTCIKQSKVID